VAAFSSDPTLNGKNIPEITKLKRKRSGRDDQIEQILDMQLAGGAGMVYHGMNEKDVERIMKHSLTMIASDSGVHQPGQGVPHPRGYGNNARVLGEYVHHRKLITLEDAIRKMTSLPAQTFKLKDRGLLREGMWADIVIFDPEKIHDTATFKSPHQYAEGMPFVLVNGTPVVFEGKHTGVYPGQVLYGPGVKTKSEERRAKGEEPG
jgi:N-acyl-D-amino-acid deacylase